MNVVARTRGNLHQPASAKSHSLHILKPFHENHDIMVIPALVPDVVHQFPDKMNAKSADWPILDRERGIRRSLAQWVELRSIVGNRDSYTFLIQHQLHHQRATAEARRPVRE